jgi:hypothetical protein
MPLQNRNVGLSDIAENAASIAYPHRKPSPKRLEVIAAALGRMLGGT